MNMPIAILAGGLATRMRPLTENLPKSLLLVAGEPFIHHQLRLLKKYGAERVVLCVGHLGSMLEEYVGDGRKFGLEAAYSRDGGKPLGTGGALKKALPLLGEAFMVLYGDSYLEMDYAAAAAAFGRCGAPAMMTVYRNRGRYEPSNALFRDGRIRAYDKRNATPDMDYIDYGLGCLRSEVVSGWPEEVFELAGLYAALAREGQLAGHEVAARFYEIGSPQGLRELDAHLAGRKRKFADNNRYGEI
jgi:NDP-sugar pyrophosphorylase family protein